jgi:hypothetical protein
MDTSSAVQEQTVTVIPAARGPSSAVIPDQIKIALRTGLIVPPTTH